MGTSPSSPDLPPFSSFSVVIPALDEEEGIAAAIASVRDGSGPDEAVEVLVVDGGSADGTPEVAAAHGARVLRAPRGRALQMNAGAAAARGDVLVFLHADTRLPSGWTDAVRHALARPGACAGAFRFGVGRSGWRWRVLEAGVMLRCRLLELPYGDQAIFLPRDRFHAIGGFRPMRYLEDLDLIARLRSRGRIVLAEGTALTSPRAWERKGLIRQTARNWSLALSYALGDRGRFDLDPRSDRDGIGQEAPAEPARICKEPANFS